MFQGIAAGKGPENARLAKFLKTGQAAASAAGISSGRKKIPANVWPG